MAKKFQLLWMQFYKFLGFKTKILRNYKVFWKEIIKKVNVIGDRRERQIFWFICFLQRKNSRAYRGVISPRGWFGFRQPPSLAPSAIAYSKRKEMP